MTYKRIFQGVQYRTVMCGIVRLFIGDTAVPFCENNDPPANFCCMMYISEVHKPPEII